MAVIESNARLSTSLVDRVLRKQTEPIRRKLILLAAIKAAGRETYNHSGDKVKWRPRFRRHKIVAGFGNPTQADFEMTNVRREVSLPWREYHRGEAVTKFERLASQNSEVALFNVLDDTLKTTAEDFMFDLESKLYLDGNAGAGKDIMGLESPMSVSGCVTNSPVGNPNDTYAGQSTALGEEGSWTPASGLGWPTGTGDTEYCWWSPCAVVDYTNTAWTASPKTWPNTWQEVIGYELTYLTVLQSVTPDLLLLDARLLNEAKNSLAGADRFLATDRSGLTQLGHKTLKFENLEIGTGYGIPDGVGYFLTYEYMELMSMQGQLIATSRDYDLAGSRDRILVDSYLQLRLDSPAFFGKVAKIT